jgi:hypothetical protein
VLTLHYYKPLNTQLDVKLCPAWVQITLERYWRFKAADKRNKNGPCLATGAVDL